MWVGCAFCAVSRAHRITWKFPQTDLLFHFLSCYSGGRCARACLAESRAQAWCWSYVSGVAAGKAADGHLCLVRR